MRRLRSVTVGATAALFALLVAALCLGDSGLAADADSGCIPTADGSPRFCAQPIAGDYALVAVPPAPTPTARPATLATALTPVRWADAERQLYAGPAAPRAPPAPLA